MEPKTLVFSAIAVATLVTGAVLGNIHVLVAFVVALFYALSGDVSKPYEGKYSPLWAGAGSVLSFVLLVASVGLAQPESTPFDIAWYGYVAASTVYAVTMAYAPDLELGGWVSWLHWGLAYGVLLLAVAFSGAVAVRVTVDGARPAESVLAITGAAASVCLDGLITAAWFLRQKELTKGRVNVGRVSGIAFVAAVSGLFAPQVTTAVLGVVAGVLMVGSELVHPIDPGFWRASVCVRIVPIVLGIAAVWLPHAYGLCATAAEVLIAVVTLQLSITTPTQLKSVRAVGGGYADV
tara:strand:+ start:5700 stop:6578 length:879 start_codon:yes stop_codon:yes gene_type:complete